MEAKVTAIITNELGWQKQYQIPEGVHWAGTSEDARVQFPPTDGIATYHVQIVNMVGEANVRLINLSPKDLLVENDKEVIPLEPGKILDIFGPDQVIHIASYKLQFQIEKERAPHRAIKQLKQRRIGVRFILADNVLRPDSCLSGLLSLQNLGSDPCQFNVELDGFPPECYEISPPPRIYAGGEENTEIRFYHRKTDPGAGSYALVLRVSAPDVYRGEEIVIEQTLKVMPYYEQRLKLTPDKPKEVVVVVSEPEKKPVVDKTYIDIPAEADSKPAFWAATPPPTAKAQRNWANPAADSADQEEGDKKLMPLAVKEKGQAERNIRKSAPVVQTAAPVPVEKIEPPMPEPDAPPAFWAAKPPPAKGSRNRFDAMMPSMEIEETSEPAQPLPEPVEEKVEIPMQEINPVVEEVIPIAVVTEKLPEIEEGKPEEEMVELPAMVEVVQEEPIETFAVIKEAEAEMPVTVEEAPVELAPVVEEVPFETAAVIEEVQIDTPPAIEETNFKAMAAVEETQAEAAGVLEATVVETVETVEQAILETPPVIEEAKVEAPQSEEMAEPIAEEKPQTIPEPEPEEEAPIMMATSIRRPNRPDLSSVKVMKASSGDFLDKKDGES